jgi:hypothetical protein
MIGGTSGPPAQAPWLGSAQQQLATVILRSHQSGFGVPLLAGLRPDQPALQQAQALFAAPRVVLAHDGANDPRLIYANGQALALWRRPGTPWWAWPRG